VSSLATAPRRPTIGSAALAGRRAAQRVAALPPHLVIGVGVAVVLAAVAFGAGGGQDLPSSSWADVWLTAGGGVLGALAIALGRTTRLTWGGPALWLFAALTVWTAISVTWAVSPDDAWIESARTLSYAAVFGGGLCLARIAPRSGAAVLTGVVVAALAVSLYALASKVFPGQIAPDEIYARLRAPFGYWNAVGVMAALGVPGALWLGARRDGRPALAALAYPVTGVLLLTVILAYSRGSLLALAIGLALWFRSVPLRLRGVAVLVVSGAGTLLVAVWTFGQDRLTKDGVPLPPRSAAGHELGILVLVLAAVLLAAGLVTSFALAQGPFSPALRRRAGHAIAAVLLTGLVAFLVIEATQPGGLGGRSSSAWHQITDTHAKVPSNQPSRLAATGSVRARYWGEAGSVWASARLRGVGAGGFATARQRYSRDEQRVRHAHGYVMQTLADLGLVGLALSVLLLLAWARAALRAAPLRGPGTEPRHAAERAATLTLLSVVVVFGVHSLVDWTWFIPGTAVPALLAAGWLAGRGPLAEPSVRDPGRSVTASPARLAAILGLAAGVLICAWAALGPLRSQHADDRALSRLIAGDLRGAERASLDAADSDPLSPQPLYLLASVQEAAGHPLIARATLERAVRLVPDSSEPWLRLASFEETTLNRPQESLAAYIAALALDPHSKAATSGFLRARQEAGL
jgi:tetratricopeptide (TPR) repeat protein